MVCICFALDLCITEENAALKLIWTVLTFFCCRLKDESIARDPYRPTHNDQNLHEEGYPQSVSEKFQYL
jgi:hypothetical protein